MVLRLVALVAAFLSLSTLYSNAINPNKENLQDQQVNELISQLEEKMQTSLSNLENTCSMDDKEHADAIDDIFDSVDTVFDDAAFDQFKKLDSGNLEDADVEYKMTLSDRWEKLKIGVLTLLLESYFDAMFAKYDEFKELSRKEFLLLIPSTCWHFNKKCYEMLKTGSSKVWRDQKLEQYGNDVTTLDASQRAWVSYIITKNATLGVAKSGIDTVCAAGSTVAGISKNIFARTKNTASSIYKAASDRINQWNA